MRFSNPSYVLTRTPLRVSFAGGGTDLAAFYEMSEYGAVLSTAINKYIYVTVKRHSDVFNEPIRVNYSRSEEVHRIEEIQNNIARECLRFLGIDPPIYISTVGDLPASTGLGGSSSFAVGLLNALHVFRGEKISGGALVAPQRSGIWSLAQDGLATVDAEFAGQILVQLARASVQDDKVNERELNFKLAVVKGIQPKTSSKHCWPPKAGPGFSAKQETTP